MVMEDSLSFILEQFAPTVLPLLPEGTDPHLQRPFPVLKLHDWDVTIILPTMLPVALMGVMVGLLGWSNLRQPGQLLWRRAFLWFAAMNTTAIAAHNFIPASSLWKGTVMGLDVGCTCTSSLLLIAASLGKRASPAAAKQLHTLSSWVGLPLVALAVLGNFSAVRFPLLNELMYIGTTSAAIAVLFVLEVLRPLPGTAGAGWMQLCAVAAVPGLLAPLLCDVLFNTFGPHVNPVHALFMSCNLGFICLYKYLQAQPQLQPGKAKRS